MTFLANVVVAAGRVVETLTFGEGCDEDEDDGWLEGASCDGLKKSRMDLFPGGMIHPNLEAALYGPNWLSSGEPTAAPRRTARLRSRARDLNRVSR